MRHQCISTTVTFFLLLINKNSLTQTSLAHSRWLAYYFNWRDVFLDVATTSDEHADEADCHRNYEVGISGPHPSYGKWQGTRYFCLFSDSNFGAYRSRVSCIKDTPVGVKRLGPEADHSPAPSTDVNSEWSNNFTTHIWLHGVYRHCYTLLWLCETWSMLNHS
jgi:hypothetical protein